jgi:hypothetical protein
VQPACRVRVNVDGGEDKSGRRRYRIKVKNGKECGVLQGRYTGTRDVKPEPKLVRSSTGASK